MTNACPAPAAFFPRGSEVTLKLRLAPYVCSPMSGKRPVRKAVPGGQGEPHRGHSNRRLTNLGAIGEIVTCRPIRQTEHSCGHHVGTPRNGSNEVFHVWLGYHVS